MHLDPDPKHCNKAFTQASHSQHVNTPLLSNHNAWGGGGGELFRNQGCGSAFIFCRSGSSCFSQYGSGSSFKSLVKKYLLKSFFKLKKRLLKRKNKEKVQIYLIKKKKKITIIGYQFPCIFSVVFQFFPSR